MADFNGNSFEMGRLLGSLQAHMDHHGEVLGRQNEILLDIKDTLTELPQQIASRIATPASVTRPEPRILPEVSELLRALYPLLILAVATLGKATWPTALPIIRAALEAAMTHGAG